MARSMWKGAISFGLVHIPVEMYPAVSDKGPRPDMLDRRDFSPIGFKRYNKRTGKEVTWDDIVKGYEYEDGEYVVLSDEDLRRANPEATQTIDIQAFVDAADVPLTYYDQPYYLAPAKAAPRCMRCCAKPCARSARSASPRGHPRQAAPLRAGLRGRHDRA
jgi:DNA end-binding protein Ku